MSKILKEKLNIINIPVTELKPAPYNPRTWSKEQVADLKESIKRYGLVDPLLVNSAPNRKGVVIGGHFRLEVIKELGVKEAPVVYVDIPDIEKEKELNIRLNKNTGSFDWDLLADFNEVFLKDIGFSSEELDDIFGMEDNPEMLDLEKELKKLNIQSIEIKKGDIWQLGEHRLMCGDSTIEADTLKLMNGERADMCFTDPPYILDYLKGKKKKGDAITGFGAKRDRRYLETDSLPDNFTELWMSNIAKVAQENFHIIVHENWKNLRTIWGGIEQQGWKVKYMIVWRLPNRPKKSTSTLA